jgi:hypothetical protein
MLLCHHNETKHEAVLLACLRSVLSLARTPWGWGRQHILRSKPAVWSKVTMLPLPSVAMPTVILMMWSLIICHLVDVAHQLGESIIPVHRCHL